MLASRRKICFGLVSKYILFHSQFQEVYKREFQIKYVLDLGSMKFWEGRTQNCS